MTDSERYRYKARIAELENENRQLKELVKRIIETVLKHEGQEHLLEGYILQEQTDGKS